MINHRITHTARPRRRATAAALAVVIGTGAAGAPAAMARQADTGPLASGRVAHQHVSTAPAPAQAAPSSEPSVDWGDAGIGAGGMGLVFLLAGGGVVAVSRRRRSASEIPSTWQGGTS